MDRRRFDAMLGEGAEESGAEVILAARATGLSRDCSGLWCVEAIAGDSIIQRRARALVDATGRSAALARQLGRRRTRHDRLVALWALSVGSADRRPTDRRTLVEAIDCGWWYSALLPDGRHAAALMTDTDSVPAGSPTRDAFWSRCLEEAPHTMSRVGRDPPEDRLRVVSACSSRLDIFTGPGWLAVGDAAMSFDPLSSRGVIWRLESGLAAARAHDAFLSGDETPARDFAHCAALDFASYLHERAAVYARERRWQESAFWQRRHAAENTKVPVLREFP